LIPNRLRRIIFDLETDGLLDELTKIHSLVIRDIDEPNYVVSCCDQPGHPTIATGLKLLAEAEMVIGHNIIGFDLPAIRKLHPGYKVRKAYDTLVAARLMDPDVKTDDYRRVNFPGKLIGSHSLKAWGYRLDVLKGSYGETQDWSVWTPEMQRYCEQDTKVCQSLLRYQMNLNWSPSSLTLEHDFARLIGKQEHNGFGFDLPGATTLYAELVDLREKLTASLQNDFPPRVLVMKTPAYYEDTNTKILYARKKDAPAGAALVAGPMREKLLPFEPGSRHQAAERLIEHGWKPDEFTETGLPKVDDETLSRCVIPQARDLARYFLISKRIGQLAEGQEGWISAVRDGRIHGRVNTNGAITGRCTHSRPNVAQTPSVKTARGHDGREAMLLGEAGGWGCEMRGLWRPTRPGWVQVGADASGLELRCMAHFLHPYDNGVYREMVTTKVDGMDVHSQNRNTFGLAPTKEGRNRAKTGIYCLIYGGGDEELGRALVGLDSEHEAPARLLAVPGGPHAPWRGGVRSRSSGPGTGGVAATPVTAWSGASRGTHSSPRRWRIRPSCRGGCVGWTAGSCRSARHTPP